MNTSKRILSVLMCIAMLVSMMTTFVFASTDGSDVVVPEQNVNTLTGANPTTDVAAPVVDKNAIVVDPTVTAETTGYVLTWEGVEYSTYDVDGVATDMFVYGVNLFATIEAAQAVAPAGATYLFVGDNASDGKAGFTKPGNFYTEAYNDMPFVVGTAFDGSDWAVNEEFAAKSKVITGIDIWAGGEYNFYGFTVTYGNYAFDLNNCSEAVDVTVYNTVYNPTADSANIWVSASSHAQKAHSSLVFKNFYVSGSTGRFASEYLTNYFEIDGFYWPAGIDMGGTPYLKQGYNSKASQIVFKNWNVQDEDFNIYFQGNNTKNWFVDINDKGIAGAAGKDWRSVTIEDSIFNNSTLYNGSIFQNIYGNSMSTTRLVGNRLINTTGTDRHVIKNYNQWSDHLGLDIQNNYFQGFITADSYNANVGNGNTTGITLKNNYLANSASEIGTDFYVDSTTDTKDWHSSDWYLNPAMTIKAADLIGDFDTNAVAKTKSGFAITLYVEEGETASLSSTDAVLTSEADLSVLSAGTYTVTATDVIEDIEYSADYTVTVIAFTHPLVQDIEDTTGLINGANALFVAAEADTAAAGSLIEIVWKGKTYSAVKGTTAFATLTAAQDYAVANEIEAPNFLIKSEAGYCAGGEAEWNTFNAIVPGKYFTQNYDKKPYVASDRALDPTGSEWASNVNTGEADSFNTADGIRVKWFNLSSINGKVGIGGKYEFYGFTIFNTIQDDGNRTETIDVLFQNTYVPKSSSNALFTTWSAKFSNYATANVLNDTVYIKDLYFDGTNNGESKKNFFQAGDTGFWANLTLDGVYADFAGYTDGSNHWINNYSDKHNLTIKNSNLRNAPNSKIMFQGDNGKGINVGNKPEYDYKQIQFENNIFFNYTFSNGYTAAFVYAKQCYLNRIWFVDNYIYTGADREVYLQSGQGGDYRQPDTWYRVENNTLLGIIPTINAGRWISATTARYSKAAGNYVTNELYTAEDVVLGEITAQGKVFTIPNNNHDGGVKNFTPTDSNAWLDYARTVKFSDLTSSIKAYVPEGGFYMLSYTGTPSARIYLPSTISAADITVCDNTPVWYDTEGNEVDPTEITKDSVNITDADGKVIGANYVIEATAYVGNDENVIEATMKINVNVVPNTIVAYPESDYTYIYNEVDGKTTKSVTHPTETEVYEDMPHISGGFYDDYAMINSVNAAIIDGFANYSANKYTISAGEYKVFNWNGAQYIAKFGETFYQNVDAAYTSETSVGNAIPEYLLSDGGEWGWTKEDGFYGGNGGSYILRSPGKFFTPNYAIDPYYAGDEFGNDWVANIGTDFGQFNPDAYIKAAYVKFDNDAKAGRYELYGFTIGTGIYDGRTTNVNAIDLYLKNTYFSCDAANSYIFYGNESNNEALMGGSPDSKLYVENAYIASKGDRSFLRNSAWSDITFDAVYADFAENTKKSTSYFHQTYNESQLVIKNSFFTNTVTDLTVFEGFNNGTEYYNNDAPGGRVTNRVKLADFKAGRKALVLENNVFKNYSFAGTGSFLDMKGGLLSEIIIRNNYIDNSEATNSMKLITSIDAFMSNSVDPEMNLIIEDNTFIGFNGQSGVVATRGYTADSYMSGNLAISDGAAVAIIADGVDNSYYLDTNKEIANADLEISDWTTAGVAYDFAANNGIIVTKNGGTPSIAGITTNGDVAVYADKALTDAIDDIAATGTSYVEISLTNSLGEKASIVYTVTVLGTSNNFFKDKYVVPATDDIKTSIDKNNAMIIDYSVNDAEFGSVVTVEWQGVEYDFIKGINAFATIGEFEAYMATANVENPSVLMNSISNGNLGSTYAADLAQFGTKATGEFNIKYAGRYYTPNYNIKPYTVSGDVWAENAEFDLNNAIVARWIKVNNNLSEGTVEIYGFVAGAAFQNNGENSSGTTKGSADLYIENGYAASFEGYAAPRYAFTYDSRYARVAGAEADGSLVAKNVYISSANDRARTLLAPAAMISNVTLDGIFLDNKDADFYDRTAEENLDEVKVYLEGDSALTIKNSKATGFAYSTRFVVLTEGHDDVDNNHAIVFDNNIFENVTFGGKDAFIQVDGDITDVSITNNVIRNDFDTKAVLEVIEYYEFSEEEGEDAGFTIKANNTISAIDLKVTIKDNILVGFGAQTVAERDLAVSSILNNNYVAAVGMGGKQLTIVGDNRTIVDANFKVSEDGSLSGSEIYGMTLNGEDFNTDAQVGEVEVKYNKKAIALSDYLVNEYNVVEVYANANFTGLLDAEDIAIDTATVYLKVFSPDKTAMQTRVINFTIGEAPAPAVEAVSLTLYNDFTMNFKTVGTEVYENVYVDFTVADKTVAVSDSYVEGDYVVFSFDGIAPHLMGETIKVEIYGDVDGTAEVIGSYETTVADYLYEIKDIYEAENYELYMVAVDALNYGAAAQTYKKFNTENLVNANLTEDEQWVDEEYLENLFEVTELDGAAATWCAKGLYLDNAIDMKLAFKADDVEGMTVVVKDSEGNTVETIDTFVNRDGKYYVYFDNFTVADVDEAFTFTVMKDGAAVSGTATYSVQYYAAQAYETGIEDLQAIVNTMMAFGRSAKLYVDTYLA